MADNVLEIANLLPTQLLNLISQKTFSGNLIWKQRPPTGFEANIVVGTTSYDFSVQRTGSATALDVTENGQSLWSANSTTNSEVSSLFALIERVSDPDHASNRVRTFVTELMN